MIRSFGGRLSGVARVSKALNLRALSLIGLMFLSACGGGGGGGGSASSGSGSSSSAPPVVVVPTSALASRFLTQATFGPNDSEITSVINSGYAGWVNAQLAMPVSATHLAHMDARLIELRAANATANVNATQFYESFWKQAATSPDQLRQRVKLALSEIFVVSYSGDGQDARGLASYYDMLGKDAFGNFRTLLEDVTYHPAMGRYLTYIGNQKENAATGRSPDENYAREVMQLMTLGLYQLNLDGTVKTDLFGNTQPTYTSDDIKGLAKVFTGLSWYHPTPTVNTFFGGNRDAASYTTPMLMYNTYHSISAKSFLGTNIAAVTATTVDGTADIKTALDTLFNNPNVGPFISRQLIQRLVTSNPSPAYVSRVASVFNNNGAGVRGDMGAVVKAILMDDEARTASSDITYGKLREPIVRMANWMRAFEVTSQSGSYLLGSTSANTLLGQSALNSPSVFNFFRPGFIPPNTVLGSKNKLAPEFQLVDEVYVASYVNLMQTAVNTGVGSTPTGGTGSDIRSSYTKELALAGDPTALVERVNSLLYYGQMSDVLKTKIITAVTAVNITTGTQTQIDTARLNRVKLAVFLGLASPEFLVQR
jgi:uncharacterized protein (DUF1800 family)